MYLPDEFLKHAADCRRMAKVARDQASKATWRKMSERWAQCAEWARNEYFLASNAAWTRRHRVSIPTGGRVAASD